MIILESVTPSQTPKESEMPTSTDPYADKLEKIIPKYNLTPEQEYLLRKWAEIQIPDEIAEHEPKTEADLARVSKELEAIVGERGPS